LGLTSLADLIEVLECGFDLCGREHPALHALGLRCRVLIVPTRNPDGIARFPRGRYTVWRWTTFVSGGRARGSTAHFKLISTLCQISGATALTFECPRETTEGRACYVTLDQILDIQLTLYEAMFEHALDKPRA
jgi:hypothetical protein